MKSVEDRLIRQEVKQATGQSVVIILWEVAKFSDSLDPIWLKEELENQGYPPWTVAITMVVVSH